MAFRTFLGPTLIGTQKNGAGRNTGLVQVVQTVDIAATTATGTAFVLPAGAAIVSATALVTTAFNGTTPTIKLSIGATDITAAVASATAGQIALTCAATSAGAGLWRKATAADGVSDATVTYTIGGTTVTTGNATIQIEYAVADPSGAQQPAAAGSGATYPGP